jgi:uncharacterized protein YeaO (DUF488 family)
MARAKNGVTAYRYGSPRCPGEGLRIGSARHLPRGVKRTDWQSRNYFDTWLPLVAPTADLVTVFKHEQIDFRTFASRYRTQMKAPEARHVIDLLAAVARNQPISVGCFCEDESRCHRSILRGLIAEKLEKSYPGGQAKGRPPITCT